MATIVHDTLRNGQLGNPNGTTATVDFDTDDIRPALIDDTDMTAPTGPPLVTHDDWADLNQGTVVDAGANLAGKTVGSVGVGIFDATDFVHSSVSGDTADYLNLRAFNATDANSALLVTYDSTTTGLPVIPNGGDITDTWAGGGILSI